jgi:hypothetical protein
MEPSRAQLDAMTKRFSRWAWHYYRLQHGPHVRTFEYTTEAKQRRCGDVRVECSDSGRAWNYDEKAFSSPWSGLLVELLQASEPNATNQPTSLGWFYDLAECDHLLCGYFATVEATDPILVCRVDLRRLRTDFVRLMRVGSERRSFVSVRGYGVTVGLILPWPLLVASNIVDVVYDERGGLVEEGRAWALAAS